MKTKVKVILEFDLDTDADSQSDAEWDAFNYIKEHIMDDEDQNPIRIYNVKFT